ncbi:MAG TPA: DUF1700 domain-containing protein [Mollicutes bacterium]|nr:DUF1700 domain-containing protein [Mollicutes bacterium]
MTKKTFLKKLETSLSSLEEKEVKRILKKYEKIIDDEVGKGKNEKEVVASLGDIKTISQLYFEDDENNVTSKSDNKSTVDSTLDGIIHYVEGIFDKIDSDLAKRLLLILCLIFIGLFSIMIFQIPFKMIDYSGRIIIRHLFDNRFFFRTVRSLWSFGLGICFFVLVIYFIVKYVEKIVTKYSSMDNIEKKDKTKSETKKDEPLTSNNYNSLNNVQDIVFTVLKVFVFILSFPILLIEAGLVVTLIIMILLMFNGVLIFGPPILVLSFIIMIAVLLDLIYNFVFKGGIK